MTDMKLIDRIDLQDGDLFIRVETVEGIDVRETSKVLLLERRDVFKHGMRVPYSERMVEDANGLDVGAHTPRDPRDPQRFDGGRPDRYRTPTPPGSRKVHTTPVDLRGDGVLWMINRSLFHPLGFALAYTPDTGEFTLWGNGDETWRFEDTDEDELFQAFQSLLARVRVKDGGPQS